jgi:homogentisate 1,2-dioxygenase
MIPQRKGLASRQAHVDLPEGTVEEEHGRQAFGGRASHLYRTAPPTAWVEVGDAMPAALAAALRATLPT